MDLDVKALMLRFAATQMEYVREDLENYSEAMVAIFPARAPHYVKFQTFQDWDSKEIAYAAIVAQAKIDDALLIVTVNHARSAKAKGKRSLEDYQWGDLNECNSDTCILLTASGPGLVNCSLEVGFSVSGKYVNFQEPEWMYGSELHLLPGWSQAE